MIRSKKKPVKTIRQIALIPAKPAAVYRALTDPKQHQAVTGARAAGRPKVGGSMSAYDGYIWGTYIYLRPASGYAQTWQTSDWPAGYEVSRLEIMLKASKRGTQLTMIHSNVPASQALQYSEGWKLYYWQPLQAYFN